MKKIIHNNNGFSLSIVIGSLVFVSAISGLATFFLVSKNKKTEIIESGKKEEMATTTDKGINRLPGVNTGKTDGNKNDAQLIQSEKMTFADFYKKIEEKIDVKNNLKFPINIKTEVVNYYDTARMINLEKQVSVLNETGLAMIDNPFGTQISDFYGAYDFLAKKNTPILITSDFLIYYYQNSLKDVYDKIKNDVFYREIWEVNKKMFAIADARFKARQAKSAGVNDAALEGMKLEAAYFAVALELLKPKPGQISNEKNQGVDVFTADSQYEFGFVAPDYLTEIVNKEAELAKKAVGEGISPVFLYKRDYKNFKVSEVLFADAKLANFYQATQWMNFVFPLYYRGDYCPDCLLDNDDWTVNMVAAGLIAEDFAKNQETKNQWARVYKGMSFFEGLRQELSHLHYSEAMNKVFGVGYKVDDIFSSDRAVLEENLIKLQGEVLSLKFPEIEGGLDRDDKTGRANIGMKMLQDAYWPDNYIFEQLIYPKVTAYQGGNIDANQIKPNYANKTYCSIKGKINRCRAIGTDIVSLIYNFPENNLYFSENAKYDNYDKQLKKLKDQTEHFNLGTWHNNGFWSTLNLGRKLFYPEEAGSYFDKNIWFERNLNTLLGSWVNLRVVNEKMNNRWQLDEGADISSGVNYIEPNIGLINELLASSRMLKDALIGFGEIKEKSPSWEKISDLTADLEKIREIVKKELTAQALDYNDSKAIVSIAEKFIAPAKGANKSFRLTFKNNSVGATMESINGIKFTLLVYEQAGKKYLAIGPIFNYKEGNK